MSSNFGKKGNVQELAFVIGAIVFLGFIIIMGFKVQSALNDKIQSMSNVPNEAKAISDRVTTSTPNMMDKFFLMVVIVFFLSALISSWFIDTSPVFFILSVIVILVIFVIGAVMNNANEAIMEHSNFSTITPQFPIIYFFSQHMFQIVVVMGILLLAALYAKSRSMTN